MPKGVRPAAGTNGPTWEAVTARQDRNKDGKVAKDEFGGPAALFERLDTSRDGFLTRDEHEAFIERRP